MEISVQLVNLPGSSANWKRSLSVPKNELPALSEQQKNFAKRFGMSDEEYARSVWAGRFSEALYQRYAEQLGKFLHDASLSSDIELIEIAYDGWKNKFYCTLQRREGERIPLVIDGDIIIRPLETGDDEGLRYAARRVKRVAELALESVSQRIGFGGG